LDNKTGDLVRLTNPNLFIVSGGPGAGKTTVLRELAKYGFAHAPEVARQIIQEQVQSGGDALPWKDRESYTHLMLQRSIDSYLQHTPVAEPMFSDRGIPDSLCYARLIGIEEDDLLKASCWKYRYAPLVFLAPPWEEIYKTDAERKQDFSEAKRTYELLEDVYRECGCEIVELPKLSPGERATFILRRLSLGK
jgi:predicted ATPase